MARQARGEVLNPHEIQVVHGVQRCVRRQMLCGKDDLTGKSFEHRKQWIRDRLEFLASVFGIDCLTYTVMSNHLHVILRSRPDVVATWSDAEVARRWLMLFPKRKDKNGKALEPDELEVRGLASDQKVIAERRTRLSDISWWMRCLAEVIARLANKEDKCTGRFWEGRYKAQLLLDDASILACAAYVDLNPIRAAMAKTPETSKYTGAKDRIDDLKEKSIRSKELVDSHQWERSQRRKRSRWMSPIEIDQRRDRPGADPETNGKRASRKGFLSISLKEYLNVLDWTGRQIKKTKRGSIPKELSPILDRIGIQGDSWCELVSKFGRIFKRAAGTSKSLGAEANRRNQNWMHSPGSPFTSKP